MPAGTSGKHCASGYNWLTSHNYRRLLLRETFANWVEAERGRFSLLLPVAMGAAILAYFALPMEPPLWVGPLGLALSGRPSLPPGTIRICASPPPSLWPPR